MDPSEAFQVAIAARLLATSAVTAIAGQRVLSTLDSQGALYPRVEIGQSQFLPDDGACAPQGDHYETIHLWAAGPGASLKAKALKAAVRAALAPPPPTYAPRLVVPGWRVSSAVVEDGRDLTEDDATNPKGAVAHGVLTIRFRVQAVLPDPS